METEPQKYEYSNCVMVPLPFFDKLMKCYYGNGARDGETEFDFIPENKSSEVFSGISDLKNITIDSTTPEGFTPSLFSATKLKAKERGTRHSKPTEEPDSPSKDN